MSLGVMNRLSPKRIPVDKIGDAETRLSEMKARAAAAEARREATAQRLAEGRKSLEEAAESGAELAPIARAVLEAETELKALALEADPLAGAVRRAEEALADLREERRLALLDAQLEKVNAADEVEKACVVKAASDLAYHLGRAYGLDRLRDALLRERNGKSDSGTKSLYENGEWMQLVEDATSACPFVPAPEDAEKAPSRWSLKLNVRVIDPQAAARAIRHELLTEKP